jgi:plastocyanin
VKPSSVFVIGTSPDWNQPEFYANNAGYVANPSDILDVNTAYYSGSEPQANFRNWCAPTAAACQLGHLADTGRLNSTGTPVLNDNINAGQFQLAGQHNASCGPWNSASGWGDWMLDGPGFRAKSAVNNCEQTDIGWWMNTNSMGQSGGTPGTTFGTTIQNIHTGLGNFYKHAGWTVNGTDAPVGAAYHKQPGVEPATPGSGVLPPAIDNNGAEMDEAVVLQAIKHEIDNDRTVLACFAGWNVSATGDVMPSENPDENDIHYYQIDAFQQSYDSLQEQYTSDSETSGEAIGHTVCVVGYIPAGGKEDPTGSTEWLIVRDNDHNTPRNVAIPYNNVLSGSRTGWNCLLATIYVNPQVFTQQPCVTPTPTPTPSPTLYNTNLNINLNYDRDHDYAVSYGTSGYSGVYEISSNSDTYVSGANPTIRVRVGDTLTFNINAPGHPLWINTHNSTGTSYALGASGNGTDSGTITWTPSSAGTFYYNCQYHSSMNGVIEVYEDFTAQQQADIQAAADKWSQIIGTDTTVNIKIGMDLQEYAPNGILAAAGPTQVDTSTMLPSAGEMHFDPSDIGGTGADLDGTIIGSTGKSKLYYTALHEIGHILGIGTFWKIDLTANGGDNRNWLVDTETGAPYTGSADSASGTTPGYVGPVAGSSAALNYYNQLTGNNYTYLPVEDDGGQGTALSHPEEGDGDTRTVGLAFAPGLEAELMTGWIDDTHMPISGITIGFLDDLGWDVNYQLAESVTLQQQ